MSFTGLPIFDETVQLSNLWLNDLMDELSWKDKKRAYRILRATLHALRDRLTPHEAVHLGAQLPMLIRGLYYENWHMKDAAPPEHTKQTFLITCAANSGTTRPSTWSDPCARFSNCWREGLRRAKLKT